MTNQSGNSKQWQETEMKGDYDDEADHFLGLKWAKASWRVTATLGCERALRQVI
jgi:hypothetical protein